MGEGKFISTLEHSVYHVMFQRTSKSGYSFTFVQWSPKKLIEQEFHYDSNLTNILNDDLIEAKNNIDRTKVHKSICKMYKQVLKEKGTQGHRWIPLVGEFRSAPISSPTQLGSQPPLQLQSKFK